jgi:voltage-gated potassium channel
MIRPRNLGNSTNRARLRLAVRALLRVFASVAAILLTYYWIPVGDGRGSTASAIFFVTVGLVIFGFVFYQQVIRVSRDDHPAIRAVEALASALALFLCVFAIVYYAAAVNDASVFSEPLDRTDALYFTVTVFSTVGFGDITPIGTPERVITMAQMILDITFLAVLVRILTTVTQRTMERRGIKVGDASPLAAGSKPPADDS